MVNWETIGIPFLNWKTRRKCARMEKELKQYVPSIDVNFDSPVKPITGTFIYAVPPDYEGVNTTGWSAADWESEFRRLRIFGIDTAILQSTITEDTQNRWYINYPISESTFREIQSVTERLKISPIKKPNVLPTILNAAQKTKMKIHLGLFGCMKGWYVTSSSQLVRQIQSEQIAIARDLVRLYGNHPAVAGWYISPEIMYFLHGKKLKLNMNAFLRGITEVLKIANPNLPIGISPGSTLPKKDPGPVLRFWRQTLQDSGVDILYPQDAVGQLVYFPEKIIPLWKFWNTIAKENNLSLWANCESFERKSFNLPNPFEASAFPRLLWQLAAASPYVDKIISWECMYFLNANGAAGAAVLEKAYRRYFQPK